MFDIFKQSYFKKQLEAYEANNVYNYIEEFSEDLKKRMGLYEEDIQKAERLNYEWHVDNYIIYPVHRCHDTWKKMLEVRTADMAKSHGYSNIESKTPPKSWHYRAKGTRTEILPDIQERNKILCLIDNINVRFYRRHNL